MPPRLIPSLVLLSLVAGCAGTDVDPIQTERERRADAELLNLRQMVQRGELSSVDFEFNKAVLKKSSYPYLDKIAAIMLRSPQLKLIVVGHTDDVGNAEFNLWLSRKRASSVKDYLVEKGVLPEFVKTYGFGEKVPVTPNKTEFGRALNRRVEFRFSTRRWNAVF